MTDAALPPGLGDALTAVAATPTLLVALDFDGTLAPEVDDPALARAVPEARTAILRLLDLPQTPLALVSGRAVASLVQVAGLPEGVLLIGSHGAEERLGGDPPPVELSEAEQRSHDRLARVLGGIAAEFEGVWLDAKPAGFALHTRTAEPDAARGAQGRALAEATAPGITVRPGKNVLEFSVRSATKADAIARLRRHTGATAVFFAGDDVTDEDALRSLAPQDLGLKSGAGETAARFRVAGPAQVAGVLHALADARAAQLSTG